MQPEKVLFVEVSALVVITLTSFKFVQVANVDASDVAAGMFKTGKLARATQAWNMEVTAVAEVKSNAGMVTIDEQLANIDVAVVTPDVLKGSR